MPSAVDSFVVEFNVPKGLILQDNFLPDGAAGFNGYLLTVVTCQSPSLGTDPQRFKAFMVTPEHNARNAPLFSMVMRSEEERYFVSLKDASDCCKAATERNIAVHEITDNQFGCRTAQEMIDYFKSFDVEPRNTFPKFPSDSQ